MVAKWPPDTKKWCKTSDEIPKTEHYAIIESSSVHIPGDQRSIDCPGHGYPAYTERFVQYISFTDRKEWETEIQKRMNSTYASDKNFVAMYVTPAKIQTTHNVTIGLQGGCSA